MADIGFALEAKSDQLNAVDIMGAEPVIRIREVRVNQADQPIHVFFEGDNNRPWKPSKGMLRILAGAWGRESDKWIGRFCQLYFEPTVVYAGKQVGGIRVKAMSDIDKRGVMFTLAINRGKREPYKVEYLSTERPAYPDAKFKKALPIMGKKLQDGEMTLQQVIAQCQVTGDLSKEQLAELEKLAPVEINDHDNEDEVY